MACQRFSTLRPDGLRFQHFSFLPLDSYPGALYERAYRQKRTAPPLLTG